MRVFHVMPHNAMQWPHECCMGFVLGRKPESETLKVFRVKRLQPAMNEGQLVCVRKVRAGLGVVRTVVAVSMCFACSCALQFHGALEALVAKCIVMAA